MFFQIKYVHSTNYLFRYIKKQNRINTIFSPDTIKWRIYYSEYPSEYVYFINRLNLLRLLLEELKNTII